MERDKERYRYWDLRMSFQVLEGAFYKLTKGLSLFILMKRVMKGIK